MKERPILFKGRLVRAILAGQKTVTRRPVKSLLGFGNVTEFQQSGTRGYDWQFRDTEMRWHDLRAAAALASCPYGVPGDVLWVREAWQHEDGSCDDHCCGQPTHIYYRATETYPESMRWRPSIFMPRWACRIMLRVTEVSIERIQDITPIEILAEGVTVGGMMRDDDRIAIFASGWDSMYAGGSFAWDASPYVWVVRFERIML